MHGLKKGGTTVPATALRPAASSWHPVHRPGPATAPVPHRVRRAPLRVVAICDEEVGCVGDEAHMAHLDCHLPLLRRLLRQAQRGAGLGQAGVREGGDLAAREQSNGNGSCSSSLQLTRHQLATTVPAVTRAATEAAASSPAKGSNRSSCKFASKGQHAPLPARAGGPAAAHRAAHRPPWASPHCCTGGAGGQL